MEGHGAVGGGGGESPADQPGRRRMQKLFRRAQSSLDPRRRAATDRLSTGSDGGAGRRGLAELDSHSSASSMEGTPPRPIPRPPTGVKRQHDQVGRNSAELTSSQMMERISAAESFSSQQSEPGPDATACVAAGPMIVSVDSDSGFKSDGKKLTDFNRESGDVVVGLVASNSNYQGPQPLSEKRSLPCSGDASILSLAKVKPVTIASHKPTQPHYPSSQSTDSSIENSSHDRNVTEDRTKDPPHENGADFLADQPVKKLISPEHVTDSRSRVEENTQQVRSPDLSEVLDLIDVHFNRAHENEPDTSDTSNITSPELLAGLTGRVTELGPSFMQPGVGGVGGILTTENGAVLNISPRSRSRMHHKQDSPKVRRVIKPDVIDFDRDSPSPDKEDITKQLKTDFPSVVKSQTQTQNDRGGQGQSGGVVSGGGMTSGASSFVSTPDDLDVFTDNSLYKGGCSSMESSYISAVESRGTETETDELTTPDSLTSPDKTLLGGSGPSRPAEASSSPAEEPHSRPKHSTTTPTPRSHKPVKAEYSVSTTSRVLGADAGRRSRNASSTDHDLDNNRFPDTDLSKSMIETQRQVASPVVPKHSISYESGLEIAGGAGSESHQFVTSVKDMCLDFSRKLGLHTDEDAETESTTDSGIIRDQPDKQLFAENAEKFRSISSRDFSSKKFNTWTNSGGRQRKQRRSSEQVRTYPSEICVPW